ncbi:MAG: hypothetical protein FJY75_05985 [Candidatus Eisenbacteria bacterium]|uniref:FlgD/Vpr Ig-like domain-containing protein n=1 Tax=Eiseniibacteriota bacterium TaxID=2212470 RepID=A0A938BLU9_UNCEI|nr:hypothetical protein [Candidatus Eisenbacteria bacterium]
MDADTNHSTWGRGRRRAGIRQQCAAWTLMLAAAVQAPVAQAACADYLSHMRWIGGLETVGWFEAIAVGGDHAFALHSQFGIVAVDITDPGAIIAVDVLPMPGEPLDIALQGSLAYLAAGSGGLRIVDISDPLSMSTVGSLDLAGGAFGIAVQGDYAYLANWQQGLVIVDVSNPGSPLPAGALPGSEWGTAGVAVSGDYAYVAQGNRLLIVDISDPSYPWVMHMIAVTPTAIDVAVAGDYVYVVSDQGGLVVVNVSNILFPVVTATLAMDNCRSIALGGERAFVSQEHHGLSVVDISDPFAPAVEAGVLVSALAAAVAGDHAFVAGVGGIQVIDIQTVSRPAMVGSVAIGGYAAGLDVADGRAYVPVIDAYWGGGLQIIDVSDPTAPASVSYTELGAADEVSVEGARAYLTQRHVDGWRVQRLDVTDPLNPVECGRLEFSRDTHSLRVAGSRPCVLEGWGEPTGHLRVMDASLPDTLLLTGSVALNRPRRMELAGDYAFVSQADSESALVVVDVSDPFSPAIVAAWPSPSPEAGAGALALHGSFLYVVIEEYPIHTLHVVDISNPLAPLSRGHHPLPPWMSCYHLTAGDGHLYVVLSHTNAGDWMQVFDLVDPAAPAPAGGMWVGSQQAQGVVVFGESVCLTFFEEGLRIAPAQCSSIAAVPLDDLRPRFLLSPPFPNPVAQGTELCLRLPGSGHAALAIWDVNGRPVRRLREGLLSAGEHRIAWDGRDDERRPVPQGVYFARLRWRGAEESTRLVVVR